MMATLEFESDALGQWLDDKAAHGPGFRRFTIFGSDGQIDLPSVRTGHPLRLFRDDHDGVLDDDDVLALVPDFALDDRTARFFGGERLARYGQSGSGVGGGGDLNILAMELAELLDAIDNGTPVEVGPEEGIVGCRPCDGLPRILGGGSNRSHGGGRRWKTQHLPKCCKSRVGN